MSGGLTYRRSYVNLSLAKMTKESKVFHTNKTLFLNLCGNCGKRYNKHKAIL